MHQFQEAQMKVAQHLYSDTATLQQLRDATKPADTLHILFGATYFVLTSYGIRT